MILYGEKMDAKAFCGLCIIIINVVIQYIALLWSLV